LSDLAGYIKWSIYILEYLKYAGIEPFIKEFIYKIHLYINFYILKEFLKDNFSFSFFCSIIGNIEFINNKYSYFSISETYNLFKI